MWKEKLIKWFLKTEVEKVVEILKLFFYINYVILLHFLNSSWNIWLKSKRYTFVFIFKYHKLLHVHTYVHMYLVTFLHFSINFAFLSFFYFFFLFIWPTNMQIKQIFCFSLFIQVPQTGDGFLNFTSIRHEHSGWYKCTSRHLNFQYSSIGYYLSVRCK